MTASEEQAGFERGRASLDRVRADRERARRPANESPSAEQNEAPAPDQAAPAPDQGGVEPAGVPDDVDGDIAPEHNRLTVADDPLDKPTESDAR